MSGTSAASLPPVRAPQRHGEALVRPEPLKPESLLANNTACFAELRGTDRIDLAAQRQRARLEIVALARRFTAAYRTVEVPDSPTAPLVVTGHQPALYHPGVWFKNFLVHHLAAQTGGVAINVIIDNDVAPLPSIAALSGSPQQPQPARLGYDRPGPRLPWEMTRVQDEAYFRNFPQRVAETFQPFVTQPAVAALWPRVLETLDQSQPLGLAFSQGRSLLEETCGLQVLDVPLSRLSQCRWFLETMLAIWDDASGFREIYNACVADYRGVHKIRSRSHPVPDLEQAGSLVEVPFWIWTTTAPQRRRLWVARQGSDYVLSDRGGWDVRIARQTAGQQLAELEQQGVCIRSRALTTTMFLRLLASDVFVHGIGAAQYDQVTNAIISRFWKVRPPQFVTATATLHLPVSIPSVSPADRQRAAANLRDAYFNPDRIDAGLRCASAEAERLTAEKEVLLRSTPDFPEKRTWHQRLQEVNRRLREINSDAIASLVRQQCALEQTLQHRALLASREYSYCLFPIPALRDLLLDLARNAS